MLWGLWLVWAFYPRQVESLCDKWAGHNHAAAGLACVSWRLDKQHTWPPYYSPMTDYSRQLTSQKLHSKASPPSLSEGHLCSGTSTRICPGNCPCRLGSRGPAAEVAHSPRLSCIRLRLLFACIWNTHWRDSEWEAGDSPYTWHCLVFLPGKAAGFWYPSWAVTGVEVLGSFTMFPTKSKRQVAAGTHCIRICLFLLVFAQPGLHLCSCSLSLAVDHYSQ